MALIRLLLSACLFTAILASSNASLKASDSSTKRQIATQTPIMSPNIGGPLGNILPAILPIILIFGLGAFLLPALGVLLFGSSGGFGGLFDGFGKKRSFNVKDNALFSPEKLLELVQTVTKAIEEASKANE